LASFPAAPITFQASGFIPTCQPALAARPPAGPGWRHEIEFDGYRVIARKDGKQVRLWARTTSDYSKAFTRVRDAVAAPASRIAPCRIEMRVFVVILATMDLGLFVIFMPHDGILLCQMAKVSSHSLIFAESPGRRRANQVKTA
jgi:hypothetical protein